MLVFNQTGVFCEGVLAVAAAATTQIIIWVNDSSEYQRRNLHFASQFLPPRRCHSHQEPLWDFLAAACYFVIFLFWCSSRCLTLRNDNGLIHRFPHPSFISSFFPSLLLLSLPFPPFISPFSLPSLPSLLPPYLPSLCFGAAVVTSLGIVSVA